jgi:hypothetical protein
MFSEIAVSVRRSMMIHGLVPALPLDIWRAFSHEKTAAQTRSNKGVQRTSNPERKSLVPEFLLEQLEQFSQEMSTKQDQPFRESDVQQRSSSRGVAETPKRGRGRPVSCIA